ncbi:MAG: hypothetical protein DRJ52_04255 [Thermoprotei archaeon]|nr:MAG: hypothetical protein DRJ52_04255 [Thermoprotei archaeon]
MFDKAFQLSIMIFSSLMVAQLFSRLLFEKKFYRKSNFILLFLTLITTMYRLEPAPFDMALSLLTPPFRLEYLMTVIIAFLPFLIPVAILFIRGETWLLSETVVRFMKRRPLRTLLNIITITLLLSALVGVTSISPVKTVYSIKIAPSPPETLKKEKLYILCYKKYFWKTTTEYSIQREEIEPITLELKVGFLSLFKTPVDTASFLWVKGYADSKEISILITSTEFLQKYLSEAVDLSKNDSREVYVSRNLSANKIVIPFTNTMLTPSGVFTIKSSIALSRELKIFDKRPDVIIDIEELSPLELLNLIDAGTTEYIIVATKEKIEASKLAKFIKKFSTEYTSGAQAVVETPLVYQVDSTGVIEYFTIGTYYSLTGELTYFSFSAIMIAVVLFSTILGSVYERSKEYSTISCLGASPRTIYFLMFLEGAYLASLSGSAALFTSLPFLKQVAALKSSSDISSAFFISLGVSYLSVIASYLALRLKGILAVTPSRTEKYTAERGKHGGEFEVPIKIHDWNNFKRFLKGIEGKHVEAGIKILKVTEENGKLKALVACGIEREALYIFTLTHLGESVKIEVAGEKTWTAEHSRLYDLAVRKFRKLALKYTLKTSQPYTPKSS